MAGSYSRAEGRIFKKDKAILLQDLPGIYSLSPYTPEELVTRKYLLEKRPDKIVDVVDATNIERNLYLTLQLLETKIPLIVALNMADLLKTGSTDQHEKIGLSFRDPSDQDQCTQTKKISIH